MKDSIAIASQKALKASPLKVMRVTKNVTGLKVSSALTLLRFSKLRVAPSIRSIIYSAMSNAENNHNMNVDTLYIKEVRVGKAFALKRFSPRGRGKSSRILKAYSNVTVLLAESSSVNRSVNKNKVKGV